MRAEMTPVIEQQTPEETVRLALEHEAYRLQRMSEPLSPTEALGNLVVGAVIGGTLTGSVLPRTEAVTLELIAGTAEYGEDINQQQKAA